MPWGYGPEPAKASAKPAKIPVTVGDWGVVIFASTDNPDCWVDYDTATRWLVKAGTKTARDGSVIWTPAGVGRLCSSEPELWALDLDGCVTSGKPSAAAQEFIDKANTYTEISPSGRGLRLAFTGSRPEVLGLAEVGVVNGMKVESYDQLSTRYVSFTGSRIGKAARVAKPTNGFLQWFGQGWKVAPKHAQPATVEADERVLDTLEAIVRGEATSPIVPVQIDYTRGGIVDQATGEVDASTAFAAAVFAALRQTHDLRVVLASAITATGDNRVQKGLRAVATGSGRRKVEAAVYEVLRLGHTVAAETEAKGAAKAALYDCAPGALAQAVTRLVEELPSSALWTITRLALKRGLSPPIVAELTAQPLAEVARVATWGRNE